MAEAAISVSNNGALRMDQTSMEQPGDLLNKWNGVCRIYLNPNNLTTLPEGIFQICNDIFIMFEAYRDPD
jgi:hypothetical protein